jgi:acetyl esterase/lipase
MSRHPFPAFLVLCGLATALILPLPAKKPSAVRVLSEIAYKVGAGGLSAYEKERCLLDVYLPPEGKGFATLVWFHGGGLKNGDKRGTPGGGVKTERIARSLAAAGIAVVAPNYRFSPKVGFPAYIEDSAAAVAWAIENIGGHGGDPKRVFVGGHSAGGYLAFMVGLDERYLKGFGLTPKDLAGVIPVSGQTMNHYTVREERGLGKFTVTADEAAPVYFIRKETPPFLVLYAENDLAARVEENEYLVAMMKGVGNTQVTGLLIDDRTHGSIASEIAEEGDPAREAILEFMGEADSEE